MWLIAQKDIVWYFLHEFVRRPSAIGFDDIKIPYQLSPDWAGGGWCSEKAP
jgi:hypothetical protein